MKNKVMEDKFEVEELYKMEFDNTLASGDFVLFKEVVNGVTSYWINASETTKSLNFYRDVAVKFSEEDLHKLTNILNKMKNEKGK